MRRTKRFGMGSGWALAALWVLAGCAAKSPLEQLIENRGRYSAELNGFYVQAQPLVVEVAEAEPGAGVDAEPPAGEEMAPEEPASVEVIQNAHLDILLKHDSFEKLPGVTVDIVQVDTAKNEKGRWLLWLDTAKVERANPTQYSHVIEGVDYVEGDGFSVEVRHPIPEAERGGYQEFQNVGP